MARREFYGVADAPVANSIVVAAVAFVQDRAGRVLLVQRSDNGLWALPGGAQDPGEYIAETAERETFEETGYHVQVTDFIGVYSDPHHVIAYDDGEIRQQFALSFAASQVGGHMTESDETLIVRWVIQADLDDLPIHPSIRLRIDHGFHRPARPYIG